MHQRVLPNPKKQICLPTISVAHNICLPTISACPPYPGSQASALSEIPEDLNPNDLGPAPRLSRYSMDDLSRPAPLVRSSIDDLSRPAPLVRPSTDLSQPAPPPGYDDDLAGPAPLPKDADYFVPVNAKSVRMVVLIVCCLL